MDKCKVSVLGLDIIILLKALCDYANKNCPPITESQIKFIIKKAKNNLNFTEIEKNEDYGPYSLFIDLNLLKQEMDYLDINENDRLSHKIDVTQYNNLHGEFAVQKIVEKLYKEQFEIFRKIFGNITSYLKQYKKLEQIMINMKQQENYVPNIEKSKWYIRSEEFYREFFGKVSEERMMIDSCKTEFKFLREIFGNILTVSKKYDNAAFQLSEINKNKPLLIENLNELVFKSANNGMLSQKSNDRQMS